MRKLLGIMIVFLQLSYATVTVEYESGVVVQKDDGQVNYTLKVVMPTIDNEKQAVYVYL